MIFIAGDMPSSSTNKVIIFKYLVSIWREKLAEPKHQNKPGT